MADKDVLSVENDNGFKEYQNQNRIEKFGDLAHVLNPMEPRLQTEMKLKVE